MEQASGFDDQTSLSLPANQVLAIIMDLDEAKGVVETLSDNGFSSDFHVSNIRASVTCRIHLA